MRFKVVLGAAALALPLACFAAPAFAATAHNLQNGTNSTNADDAAMPAQGGMAAPMMHKKMHMKKHHMMKKM